jgi:four helix bundle protein
MQNYRKLKVWEKAHALALAVHALTDKVPRKNNTELIDQLRRAALMGLIRRAAGQSRPPASV